MRQVVPPVLALVIVAGCGSAPAAPSLAPSEGPSGQASVAREAVESAFDADLSSLAPTEREAVLDEFEAAIGSGLGTSSGRQAVVQVLKLASEGKFRLNDSQLLRRLDLEAKSLLGVDIETCAALARGELQFGFQADRMAALMVPLTAAERLEVVRILVASVDAEATKVREPRPLPDEERRAVVQAALASYPSDERARLVEVAAAVRDGRSSSDEDLCDVMRIPYGAAHRLSPDYRLLLSRYVLG